LESTTIARRLRPNNSMQRTALRAAADAGRWAKRQWFEGAWEIKRSVNGVKPRRLNELWEAMRSGDVSAMVWLNVKVSWARRMSLQASAINYESASGWEGVSLFGPRRPSPRGRPVRWDAQRLSTHAPRPACPPLTLRSLRDAARACSPARRGASPPPRWRRGLFRFKGTFHPMGHTATAARR
jgi:hypothetical protein